MNAQNWKRVRAEALAGGRINEKRVAELQATGWVSEQWAQAAVGLRGVRFAAESSGGEPQESQDDVAE